MTKGTKALVELTHDAPGSTASNGYGSTAANSSPEKRGQWSVTFAKKSGHRLEVKVTSPVTLPVGLWRLRTVTWYGERFGDKSNYASPDPLYILFNPFNQG